MATGLPEALQRLVEQGRQSAEAFEIDKINRWNHAVAKIENAWAEIERLAKAELPPEIQDYFSIVHESIPSRKKPESIKDRESCRLIMLGPLDKATPEILLGGQKGVLKIPDMETIDVNFSGIHESGYCVQYNFQSTPTVDQDGSLEMAMYYSKKHFDDNRLQVRRRPV
jgi:hypothetical protein